MNVEKFNKIVVVNLLAIFAGLVSFLLAMNVRSIVVAVYVASRAPQIPWAAAFINAITIILLILAWIIYIFLTHHHFEKKISFTRAAFTKAIIKIILPVVIAFIVSEVLIRVL